MKSESVPKQDAIKPGETIELQTRFGGLSRGKCWGKCFPGKTRPTGEFRWVEKNSGTLYLTEPGYYLVGSSDGFSREARGQFCLAAAPAPQVESLQVSVSNAELAALGL